MPIKLGKSASFFFSAQKNAWTDKKIFEREGEGGDIHPLDKFLKIFLSNTDDRNIAKSVDVSEQRFITHINMYFKNKYKKY